MARISDTVLSPDDLAKRQIAQFVNLSPAQLAECHARERQARTRRVKAYLAAPINDHFRCGDFNHDVAARLAPTSGAIVSDAQWRMAQFVGAIVALLTLGV